MPHKSKTDYRFECKAGVATIYIYDEVDRFWGIGARQIAQDLEDAGEVSLLKVRINSEGGDVFEGLAIYNLLKAQSARVEMFIDGMALSVASIVAMAGDTITMAENAYMMVHDPAGTAVSADADEHRSMANLLDSLRNTLAETYATRTGQTTDKILTLMAAETWLTASEAVTLGFADSAGEALKVAAHVDARKFSRVPQALTVKHKEPIMAESDKKTPDSSPVVEPPAVASFEALEAGLPGADSDFLVGQMKAKATLPQAQSAWMGEQNKRLATAEKDAAKAIEAKEAADKKPGLAVDGESGTPGAGSGSADPAAEWKERLDVKVKAGMTRMQASSRLAREAPELREAYVAAANA